MAVDEENGPAVSKRNKINQVRQQMSLVVLAASMVFGVCLVLAVFFIKNIKFNSQIIEAKDKAISDYETTILNVGVCVDKNKDKKLTSEELTNCDPNKIDSNKVVGTLRHNVMVQMANNEYLESVARTAQDECSNEYGTKINFQRRYDNSRTDRERELNLSMLKVCSALRVIPDALPVSKNDEALMASVNQIFLLSNQVVEALSPSGNAGSSGVGGISAMPVSIEVDGEVNQVVTMLDNLEKSIRTFDMKSATITFRGGADIRDESASETVSLKAQARAFYSGTSSIVEEPKVIYASDKGKAAAKGKK